MSDEKKECNECGTEYHTEFCSSQAKHIAEAPVVYGTNPYLLGQEHRLGTCIEYLELQNGKLRALLERCREELKPRYPLVWNMEQEKLAKEIDQALSPSGEKKE